MTKLTYHKTDHIWSIKVHTNFRFMILLWLVSFHIWSVLWIISFSTRAQFVTIKRSIKKNFMAFYDKYGTIKLKYRFLKLYAQKRCFGTAGGPLDCFSAKFKKIHDRCMEVTFKGGDFQ